MRTVVFGRRIASNETRWREHGSSIKNGRGILCVLPAEIASVGVFRNDRRIRRAARHWTALLRMQPLRAQLSHENDDDAHRYPAQSNAFGVLTHVEHHERYDRKADRGGN